MSTDVSEVRAASIIRAMSEFSPYLKENATPHHYKDQLINAV
jgi:hypothetical protein